jgi:hypothetical protein
VFIVVLRFLCCLVVLMWTAQACGGASAGGIGALPGAALVAAQEKLRVVPDRDGLP